MSSVITVAKLSLVQTDSKINSENGKQQKFLKVETKNVRWVPNIALVIIVEKTFF